MRSLTWRSLNPIPWRVEVVPPSQHGATQRITWQGNAAPVRRLMAKGKWAAARSVVLRRPRELPESAWSCSPSRKRTLPGPAAAAGHPRDQEHRGPHAHHLERTSQRSTWQPSLTGGANIWVPRVPASLERGVRPLRLPVPGGARRPTISFRQRGRRW